MTESQLVAIAQSTFNRFNRDTARENAERLAKHISANFNQYALRYGTDDICDVVDMAAREVVKALAS